MATNTRSSGPFSQRRLTGRRGLVALGAAAAVIVPGGWAMATVVDGDDGADLSTTAAAVADPGSAITVEDTAISAEDTAISAEDTAISAEDTAISAEDTAISAEDTAISAEDTANLIYMRQEEKLAGDVYALLGEAWDMNVFQNIQRAELTHQSQVAAMMAVYGIDDPVDGMGPGEFADPDIQALYDELAERGMTSATEALLVGALIEEVDIDDLRSRASDVADIDALYTRLEQGSHNHLRAFVRNLERLGVDYEPIVLDQDSYDAILAAESDSGQGHGAGQDGGAGHSHGDGDCDTCDGNQESGAGRRGQGGPRWADDS